MERENAIPRKLWLLWFQGADNAPFIVKKCIDSWMEKNPTWEIVVLDSGNLDRYVNLNLPQKIMNKIPMTQRSDLIRLALLSKYGGVWADATTFCVRSLDEWVDNYSESGFFVFCKPGPDRIISSWFIASTKANPLIVKIYKRFLLYWSKNNFNYPNIFQRKIRKVLSKILNRSEKTTKFWFNPVVTKILKIYPYFAVHYMFERVVSADPECHVTWEATKRVSADLPHTAQRLGLFSYPSQAAKEQVNDKAIPLFKLTYKYDHTMYSQDTLLYYILEGKDNESIVI